MPLLGPGINFALIDQSPGADDAQTQAGLGVIISFKYLFEIGNSRSFVFHAYQKELRRGRAFHGKFYFAAAGIAEGVAGDF